MALESLSEAQPMQLDARRSVYDRLCKCSCINIHCINIWQSQRAKDGMQEDALALKLVVSPHSSNFCMTQRQMTIGVTAIADSMLLKSVMLALTVGTLGYG